MESMKKATNGRAASTREPAGKKIGLTCYFPEQEHHRLWVSAQMARKSMTAIVEQVVTEWLERHSDVIEAASKVLRPEKLDLDR
jgi:hypothetical protein